MRSPCFFSRGDESARGQGKSYLPGDWGDLAKRELFSWSEDSTVETEQLKGILPLRKKMNNKRGYVRKKTQTPWKTTYT